MKCDCEKCKEMERKEARLEELEKYDADYAKWMDVVDEMSIGRGEYTVDFYVLTPDGKVVLEPRQVEGIYEAMRQHFSNYRTTRVERAESELYHTEETLRKLEEENKELKLKVEQYQRKLELIL